MLKIVIILLQRLVNLQLGFNKTFYNLQLRGVARRVKKNKTPEIIKQELLASIVELSDGDKDYLELNEEVRNAKKPKDGICLVKKYEDLLRAANRKIVNIVGKQGELLKIFRDAEEFFDHVGLSRSNIYFKISLYKFLRKFLLLKN